MSFRCLFIDNSSHYEQFQARIFNNTPLLVKRSRVWLPLLSRRIRLNKDHVDLYIAILPLDSELYIKGVYDYKTSKNVKQVIDTSATWDEIKGRFSRSIRKRINRFQRSSDLTSRLSDSIDEFDYFYNRMYVPFIRKRFGDLAFIASYNDMKNFFYKGELLFIERDGQPIACSLLKIEDGVLEAFRMGVLDGDESLLDIGVQFAMYYFEIQLAFENNLQSIDFRGSMPFLDDGVFQYKRSWGATAYPWYVDEAGVYFCNAKPSEKISMFFDKNPLIVDTHDGLKGVIGYTDDGDISADKIQAMVQQNTISGLNGYKIVTVNNVLDVTNEHIS